MKTILNGGSRDTQDQYIGDLNEVTIDESNREIRVHDGATKGGYTLPSRASNDSRYQSKNEELASFKFKPSQLGLMVRLGTGSYTFRALEVNTGQFDLSEARGINGNPKLTLKPQVDTDHEWKGKHTFSQSLESPEFKGKLTGDSTGKHSGDVDVRGKTLDLDDDSIPVSKIKDWEQSIPTEVTVGMIMMWARAADQIPPGWFICDGQNYTPDLRDKFVVAAGPTRPDHSTGGTNQHSHVITVEANGAHSHNVNVSGTALEVMHLPEHQHGNGATNGNDGVFNHGGIPANPAGSRTINDNSGSGTREGLTAKIGGGQAHGHGASSESAGSHSHSASAGSATHLPPYYSLIFIMKGA